MHQISLSLLTLTETLSWLSGLSLMMEAVLLKDTWFRKERRHLKKRRLPSRLSGPQSPGILSRYRLLIGDPIDMFELSGNLNIQCLNYQDICNMQCLNRPGCTVWNIIIFIVYIKNQSQTKTLMSLVEPKLSCTPQLLCRAQRIVT